jgi:putative exosortase-associated protein (TIGR04073 family)
MKRVVSIILAIALITSFTSLGYAQNAPTKLGRGILNTFTGLLEVPLKVIRISKSDGMPIGLTLGLAKGIGWALFRTSVGIYEVLTFIIPAPAGYEPITDPPTLFTSETMAGDPSMSIDFAPLSGQLKDGSTTKHRRSVK